MRHDETRDNTTNLEATLIEADAHEDTREGEGSEGTTWHECQCEDCTAPSLGSEVYADHMAEFYG
jgi:hypothetical protein